ncbi:RsmD family RNA methyltransferase [Ruficoccus amylovorans]|uniref:RsmD family RNA methyltransferase n=1 Tax=Ruficoccus amylovorans TaxID=1804625 RepID=A0A842HHK3_9BACT|nr:RsmD family RNA methyltransferase [Ruficoccus amylovorans]MBC2595809.1 RsmD family RNA methyltransferase [Ruficoccus amylovorans]
MRITGGQARGIPLKTPKQGEIRPATDYLRQAVFSSLAATVPGTRVLDLFAGSGAYGLEALSRGAASAVFVEKDRGCLACLKTNLAATAKSLRISEDVAQIDGRDVLRWPPTAGFDLIFADPPYALWNDQTAVMATLLGQLAGLCPAACFVLEAPGNEEPRPGPGFCLRKRIGKGATQPAAWIFGHGE